MHVFQQENYPPKGLFLHHFLYYLKIRVKTRKGYSSFWLSISFFQNKLITWSLGGLNSAWGENLQLVLMEFVMLTTLENILQ